MSENICAVICAPKNTPCKDGGEHEFVKKTVEMPKDKQKLQLRKCEKCGIEEYKTEVCKHCKFFNPNSVMTPIPAAGLTDQGYCFKHRTLYAETQPACIQFIKFITKWRALGEKLDELNLWKKKAELNNKKHKFNGDVNEGINTGL